MYVAPGFSHAGSAFAVSLFLWIWLRVRERWTPRGAAALGVAGALMAMVREQDAFFLAGPAIDFFRSGLRQRPGRDGSGPALRRSALARAGLAGAAGYLAAYTPQLLAYQALNGHPSPTRDVARKMSWSSPHFFDVLVSTEHGLFFWTPLALVSAAGLAWLAAGRVRTASPETRWIGLVGIILCVLQVYVSGCVESWTVAGSFGQRRFVAMTPLIALGLRAWSVSVSRVGTRVPRACWTALLALCVWWNLGLMVQFGLNRMDRQRLSPAANARVSFLELPAEMPSVLWRYFTDRSSLYGLPPR
jgi:hypothetical protein